MQVSGAVEERGHSGAGSEIINLCNLCTHVDMLMVHIDMLWHTLRSGKESLPTRLLFNIMASARGAAAQIEMC